MRILHVIVGSVVVFGLFGQMSASADTFSSLYPVTELHSSVNHGAYTPGSFAAAGMMGAQGFGGFSVPSDWESRVITQCPFSTGESIWPGICNPAGMSGTLKVVAPAQNWPVFTYSNQTTALSQTLSVLQAFRSPIVVPIYGQADHWGVITQIVASLNSSNVWVINTVKYYDSGPVGQLDSSGDSYDAGLHSVRASIWAAFYTQVNTGIHPYCDPNCTFDPYYNKFMFLAEPPPGQNIPVITVAIDSAFGLTQGGLTTQGGMTERLAQDNVWNALVSAGINNDPSIWNVISGGTAGQVFTVNAVLPSGTRWDYFLVPIVSRLGQTIAFVQMSIDDGAFEAVHVLPSPMQLSPVSKSRAEQLAQGALAKGETLTAGILTWDPRAKTPFAKSATAPYYEFGIVSGSKSAGVVRVALHTGKVERGR